MKRIIEHIRSKPQEHRSRIVYICVGFAVLAMIILWVIIGNGRRQTSDQNFFESVSKQFNSVKPSPNTNQP